MLNRSNSNNNSSSSSSSHHQKLLQKQQQQQSSKLNRRRGATTTTTNNNGSSSIVVNGSHHGGGNGICCGGSTIVDDCFVMCAAGSSSRSSSSSSSTGGTTTTRFTTACTVAMIGFISIYICISGYALWTLQMEQQQSQQQQNQNNIQQQQQRKQQPAGGEELTTTTTTTTAILDNRRRISSTEQQEQSTSSQTTTTRTRRGGVSPLEAVRRSDIQLDVWSAQELLDESSSSSSHSKKNSRRRLQKIITAYIEGPMNDTIAGTGSRGDLNDEKDNGTPPDFVIPLPLRTQSPAKLRKIEYPAVRTCHDMPAKFPIDHGLQLDIHGNVIVSNTGDIPTPDNFPQLEAPYCPVELDPFLPWIHDIFPTIDGRSIQFIAQNKRRCRTGSKFTKDVNRLLPQATLMQSISVQRITDIQAQNIAPQIWHPDQQQTTTTKNNKNNDNNIEEEEQESYINPNGTTYIPSRYRLTDFDEASNDGMYTRFICRFHTQKYHHNNNNVQKQETTTTTKLPPPQTVVLGETLSIYPFNYELAAFRKYKRLVTQKGKDSKYFWASNIRFTCPLPNDLTSIHKQISTGQHILSDGTTTLYIDLIPIRTSVRYDTIHVTKDIIGEKDYYHRNKQMKTAIFDAKTSWGTTNVIPRVEASGRWENIPICYIPQITLTDNENEDNHNDKTTTTTTTTTGNDLSLSQDSASTSSRSLVTANGADSTNDDDDKTTTKTTTTTTTKRKKPHVLSACLWASTEFKTRGLSRGASKDTGTRLQEWLDFHIMVGFDHFYIYDNSGAHTNISTLEPILNKYPKSKVTRIDWPSLVCNNNIPAHDSTGERSSQYAAENSCRTRYEPYTEWISSFDTDEYMVPMGKYTNWKDILYDMNKRGTKILSLRSSRGRLRQEYSIPIGMAAREKDPKSLYLEAYNCDSAGSPKPEWADRARKQIYRTDYVLYHFVHYSTVTTGIMKTYKETIAEHKIKWNRGYSEKEPAEHTANEYDEAVLIHTKTLNRDMTMQYIERCKYEYPKKWKGCWIAYPWPSNVYITDSELGTNNHTGPPYDEIMDPKHYQYNCYINQRVDQYWIPKLRSVVHERKKKQQQQQQKRLQRRRKLTSSLSSKRRRREERR